MWAYESHGVVNTSIPNTWIEEKKYDKPVFQTFSFQSLSGDAATTTDNDDIDLIDLITDIKVTDDDKNEVVLDTKTDDDLDDAGDDVVKSEDNTVTSPMEEKDEDSSPQEESASKIHLSHWRQQIC